MSVRPDWDINDWKGRCSELAYRCMDLEAEVERLRQKLGDIAWGECDYPEKVAEDALMQSGDTAGGE